MIFCPFPARPGADAPRRESRLQGDAHAFFLADLSAVFSARGGEILLHRLLPGGWQNLFLLAASLVFYAWGEAKYLPLIAALLLLNWALGLWLGLGRGRRLAMGLGIALNIGVLGFYKYAGFFCRTVGLARLAPQTTLPLGISFFTFQTLAYLIDVYRKEIAPEKNPVDFSAFILLFPQSIAGPIIRYSDLKNELHSRRRPAARRWKGAWRCLSAGCR